MYSAQPDPLVDSLFGQSSIQTPRDMRDVRQLQESAERKRKGPILESEDDSLFRPAPQPKSKAIRGSFDPLRPDTFTPYAELNVPIMDRVPQIGEKGIRATMRKNEGVGIAGRAGRSLQDTASSTGPSALTSPGVTPDEIAADLPQTQAKRSQMLEEFKRSLAVGAVHAGADLVLKHSNLSKRAAASVVADFAGCQAAKAFAPQQYSWAQPLASAALFPLLDKAIPSLAQGSLTSEFLTQLGASVVGGQAYDYTLGTPSYPITTGPQPGGRRLLSAPQAYPQDIGNEALRSVTVGAVNALGSAAVYGSGSAEASLKRGGASFAADFIACQAIKSALPASYYWAQPLTSSLLFPTLACTLEGRRGDFTKEFLTQLGSNVIGTGAYSYSPIL